MKQNRRIWVTWVGWILLLLAIGFVCLQLGYLFVHERYVVEYIDNRLFYVINILCVICLYVAILLLLRLTKGLQLIGVSVIGIFMIVNVILLVDSNKNIKNITSISPNYKHVFSIKENVESGEAIYYRSYYRMLALPKESLPEDIVGDYKIAWLAKDIAAFTYETADNTMQQFIGTYGDRENGLSYYYVGAEIQGEWQADDVNVISGPDGITVTENNQTELFEWDNIEQFGTLAIVLKQDDEAVWTIALDENFVVDSYNAGEQIGNISLYKADLENKQPIKLHYTN